MPISPEDVKLMASQRLADTTDGGGRMTGNEIVDGNVNNLFPDISRLDRVYGRVSLRKAFVAIHTQDNDSYGGSHVILSVPAKDPNVSVCIFSTGDPHDVRHAARNRIESYVTLGPRFQGWLWGDQPAGSRSLLIFQPVSAEVPEVGAVLCLFNSKGLVSEYSQYVRVMKVEASIQSFAIGNGTISRKVLTVTIGDPLEVTFLGIEVSAVDNIPTSIYNTFVSDAARYYGVTTPTAAISEGDVAIQVESIYAQLVPTSQAETPMLGLTPGDVGPIKKSGATQTLTFTTRAWTVLNLGQAFVPKSLALTVGSTQYTDRGDGVLMQASNQAGTIEYPLGKITFASSVSGAVSATFDPGAAMALTPTTLMVPVFAATRGYNYVAIMWPPPMPGTITVDFMAEGKWYRLRDDGVGTLVPDIANTGTGRIEYAIGQLSLTAAAIPDVDTPILIRWGNPTEIIQMQGVVEIEVEPVRHTLAGTPVAPGSLTITWPTGLDSTATATDNGNGYITGGATGWVNYGNGEVEFTPTLLPVAGSDYVINHNKYAAQVHTGSGVSFALPDAPVKAGSLAMDVPLTIGGWTHTYKLRDNGGGGMSAEGFVATLSQARASLEDSGSYTSSSGTTGFNSGIDDGGSSGDDFALNESESTSMVTAGGISATIDYVTGAVILDLTTATGKLDTIATRAMSSTSTATTKDITGWR